MAKDAVEKLLNTLRRKFGDDAATTLAGNDQRATVTDVVPTGIGAVDNYVLGTGGLPVGRVTELFSEEGAGKTSLAFACIAQAQKGGGLVVFAETENALQPERAEVFGVDRSRLVLLQPDCLEDCLEQAGVALDAMASVSAPSLFLWDSVAATPTKAELKEGLIGGEAIGYRARALSRALRSLVGIAAKKRAAILLVNQTRVKIGVMFGDPVTTPGGEAIKFASSVRLRLYAGKSFKDAGTTLGREVRVKAVKNKLAPPFRSVVTRINFEKGWDDDWTTLNYAKELGLVEERARGEAALAQARQLLAACRWSPEGIDSVGFVPTGKAEDAEADEKDAPDEE